MRFLYSGDMATYTYDDCGSGWKRDFPEFAMATQVGDIAMQRVLQKIRTDIRLGFLTREDLDKKVLLGLIYVATAGHPEAVGADQVAHLAAEINALPECRERGWTVSDKDWRS